MSSDSLQCIYVNRLTKYYETHQLPVLDGLSFSVECGKVFGLLGPNGAGKTTTIKILTGLLSASSGTVLVFNKDVQKHGLEIRRRTGVVLQKPSFEPNLTVQKSLDLYGILWGIKSDDRKERIRDLLRIFDLDEIKNMKNQDLSIGQRRRVQVAREFIHEMDLLFLDEPTVGLDPAARRDLLNYVKKQTTSGLTVVFTTHILEEAEYLCDDVAILNKGKIIALDTPDALKKKYRSLGNVELELNDNDCDRAIPLIKNIVGASSIVVNLGPNKIRVETSAAHENLAKIIDECSKMGIMIDNINITSPTLEDIFLTITKDKIIHQ